MRLMEIGEGQFRRLSYAHSNILESLAWHRPRYAPEWGSGGIFGLRYHRGYLYYTLAFEALAFFISSVQNHEILLYDFNAVGSPPRSGGDTYNAVEAVDNLVFFGGWIHAPAIFKGKSGRRAEISFRYKYSHVHAFDVDEERVKLLWKDSIHNERYWAGEVSDILYDPVNDRLLIARGDGHEKLGIYGLDYRRGKASLIDSSVALKGELYMDYACFGLRLTPESGERLRENPHITCIDLVEDTIHKVKLNERGYIDGGGPRTPDVVLTASAYSKFYAFQRGGMVYGDPIEGDLLFTRLYDLPGAPMGPVRTSMIYLNGGILVPYNYFSESTIGERKICSPSILLYITPPTARVVGVFGARITSIEAIGDKVLLATNTNANLTRKESTPIDIGVRGFTVLNHDSILSATPQPYRLRLELPKLLKESKWGMPSIYGGIPMSGYKSTILRFKCEGECRVTVYSYDLSTYPGEEERDVYRVDNGNGMNKLILEGYGSSIISFEFKGRLKSDVVIDVI